MGTQAWRWMEAQLADLVDWTRMSIWDSSYVHARDVQGLHG